MNEEFYILDKKAFSVVSVDAASDEKEFWLSKTPQERLMALEYMRQVIYGYDPATERLQRVYSIVESEFR